MAKRTCRLEIRMTKEELSDLRHKALKAGMSVGAFVRKSVSEKSILEAPSADVPVLINEGRRVGYNINQILKIANVRGLLDVPQLRKALEENHAVERMIADAYGHPWQ